MWENKQVLVCGGASFIGSHLVEQLVEKGAKVTVADNLTTGRIEYLEGVMNKICFIQTDLRDLKQTDDVVRGKETVFHLAAVHGGREFISKYPADCCQSLQINENVFRKCHEHRVKKVIFTSSVCVYSNQIQLKPGDPIFERDAYKDGWANPDSIYGWVKLTAEKSLMAYYNQYKMPSAVVRYTTVFGPRENDTHAIIALIKRALKKEDPFLVWGSGEQRRDWIYVDDAARGTILAAEKMDEPLPVNLVTTASISINDLLEKIFQHLFWRPKEIKYDITKPEGPKYRSISGVVAKARLGFMPQVSMDEGLRRTIAWVKSSLT